MVTRYSQLMATAVNSQQRQDVAQALAQAQALLNGGQVQAALALCQRILAAVPGEPHTLHLLGLIAYGAGDRMGAVAHLRQACQSPDAPAMAFSNLTEMLRQQGELAEAEQAGRAAVAREPGLVGAWNNLGIVLQEMGKLEESRACLEKVVALEPGNAEAHNNLGNTFRRLGQFDLAQRHWQQALALRPNYPETFTNLANLFNEQGEYQKARECGQRALALNPQLLDAYINLAATENALWQHEAALDWLNRLLTLAPDHPAGLAARALTLKDLERLDEALADAERAVRNRPDSAEAASALGSVLLAHGRFDEAIAAYDRALALPSTLRERLLLARAMAYQENGRSDEALRLLDELVAEFPASVPGWHTRADIVKFKADDPAIGQMEALVGPGGVQSNADRMSMHFALGKAYLDTGDSAAALRHLDQGNAMKRAITAYDPDATHRWMDSLTEAFPADLLSRFPGAGAASAMPIFVLGMPRSGTTLIEQILASHSQIAGAGELKAISLLIEQAGGMPQMLSGMTAERLTAMGEDYVARLAPLAQGKPHVVDKMPANFLHAGLIHLILPNARIIHARRDPVDTCLSCYSKLFGGEQAFSYDQAELGRFYRDYQALMAHWRSVLPPSHFIEVDYENVVEDIEREARRMLEFLGLDWEPACLDFHQTKRPVRTSSVNQVRQPVYKTSAGRWRKHAEHLGPLLAALGIDAS